MIPDDDDLGHAIDTAAAKLALALTTGDAATVGRPGLGELINAALCGAGGQMAGTYPIGEQIATLAGAVDRLAAAHENIAETLQRLIPTGS